MNPSFNHNTRNLCLSSVLMELDENVVAKAYYVYGLGLIGREDISEQYLSYHSDIRGSTTLLSDEQSRITDRYIDPLGFLPYTRLELKKIS
ncbi:hypothetical protein J2T12_000855 [Paenibacillus anaericanus]|uniref:hypothetical protein n=1 Tax=Paenibacillus anaericanus TaxID=170367 RepID=UPI002780A229|nr:hypothetical protein [Paenibacillus anaericanus]MDQ0087461.1 hypothetical protein [Paenibacillus anaericanus]